MPLPPPAPPPVSLLSPTTRSLRRGSDDSPVLSWMLKAAMCVVLAALNVRGIDWVGSSVAVLSVAVTAPLVVFCILGMFHLQVLHLPPPPNLHNHPSVTYPPHPA